MTIFMIHDYYLDKTIHDEIQTMIPLVKLEVSTLTMHMDLQMSQKNILIIFYRQPRKISILNIFVWTRRKETFTQIKPLHA